jgi:hypothetical protein
MSLQAKSVDLFEFFMAIISDAKLFFEKPKDAMTQATR